MKRTVMMISIASILSVNLCAKANADECTLQVEKYINGVLHPIKHEKYISQDKVDWAYSEANRVIRMREQMLDCDVARRISHLTQTVESVKSNNKETEKLETTSNQYPAKRETQRNNLYRY